MSKLNENDFVTLANDLFQLRREKKILEDRIEEIAAKFKMHFDMEAGKESHENVEVQLIKAISIRLDEKLIKAQIENYERFEKISESIRVAVKLIK